MRYPIKELFNDEYEFQERSLELLTTPPDSGARRELDPYGQREVYGRRGQRQFGIDLLATRIDGRKDAGQCKFYKKLTASDVKNSVDEFLSHWNSHWHNKRVARFILFASCETDSHLIQDEVMVQQTVLKKFDVEFEVWGQSRFWQELANRQGLDREWTKGTPGFLAGYSACAKDQNQEILRLLKVEKFAEASGILDLILTQAEALLRNHRPEDAAQLLDLFTPSVTNDILLNTRARFYAILGQVKLENDDSGGAFAMLKQSLDVTPTTHAALHYHRANLSLTGRSKSTLESLRITVFNEPEDPSLASLYASTLSTGELKEFQKQVPESVAASPIFVLNTALTYSQNGDYDLALHGLQSLPLSARTEKIKNWQTIIELTKLLSGLEKKNAARLLPKEEEEFSILMRSGIGLLEKLPEDYEEAFLVQLLNAVFGGRKYFKDRDHIHAVIMKTASITRHQAARLYASIIALRMGDFEHALEFIDFKPSTTMRNQSAWYLTALEAFASNNDVSKLQALRNEATSILNGKERPVEDLVIPLYQVLAASTAALGDEPIEMANPEKFAELFPESGYTVLALAYLTDIPCRVLLPEEAVEFLTSSVTAKNWGLVGLWTEVLIKLGCPDLVLKVARNFDQTVASEHLLKSLRVAFLQKDEEFALTTLQNLYEAGYRDIDLVLNFAHGLYWHKPTQAMLILQQLAVLHPTDIDVQLLLCQFAGLENKHEVVSLPTPIPHEWLMCDGERRYGILLGLLMQDRIEEAEELAFDFYLSHPSEPIAQRGILILFLPFLPGDHNSRIEVPLKVESVRPGCHVVVYNEIARTSQGFWFAIGRSEDVVQPSIDVENPLYDILLGKMIGDRIQLDPYTTLEIQEIKDWRLALFHRVLKQSCSIATHPKFMWEISVKSDDPSKEFDFANLFHMIDARRKDVNQVLSVGQSQAVPVHAFASLLETDLAAAWVEVTQAGDIPRDMQDNLEGERVLATAALRGHAPLLLDETALLSIFLFGLEDQLRSVSSRFQIGSFSLRSLAAWEIHISLFSAYSVYRGKTHPFEIPSVDAYHDRLRAFRAFVSGITEVESIVFPGMDGAYRREMVNMFGRASCQTMSAAKANAAAIICDDSSAKGIIRTEVGVECFSTFALVAALEPEQDVWIDICAQAIMLGYGGTPINARIAVRLYERLGWVSDLGSDKLLLQSLKTWNRQDPRAYAQIALILESVFLECAIPDLRRRLALRILDGVFERFQDDAKVRLVHRALLLKAQIGIQLITTVEAAKVVEDWRRLG